ncbi:50S ribosomal protein L30 [archaeon]|jgi:ribosomal protein L30E|nr:50S ribosomal protein L30 [archaeon]MBT6761666.1 50S ribosomal protein L30 [archaeon]
MATKQDAVKQIQQIKELIAAGNAIIGKNKVLSGLKDGSINKILVAKNAPAELLSDAKYYAKLRDVEVEVLEQDNEELGIICKKNFFIAIIGVTA